MSRTNADITLDLLTAAGVEVIFTCPGTTEVPLLDASVGRSSPRFVLSTHETTAVSAADGYSRATGKIGVALLHANVGLANGLAMVEAAKIGRSRLLVLNGTKPINNRNRRGFTQTPESPTIARHFTRQATSVSSSESLADDISHAIQRLHYAPHGPVYLELPQDLLAAESRSELQPTFSTPSTTPSAPSLEGAAEILRTADKVAVVAGSDLSPAAAEELATLAESLQSPIFEAPWRELERSTVDTDHPAYAGVLSYNASALEGATVFIAGTPTFQEPDTGPSLLTDTSQVVHLLNNSAELIPGALPLVGDYAPALSQITRALGAPASNSREAFREQATTYHQQQTAALRESVQSDSMTVAGIAAELSTRAFTPIVLDAVTASAPMLRLIPRGPSREFFATGSGALGWGPGAAAGVALSGKYERVYGVISDGVLQFGLPALHTAAAEKLPITYIVVNNESYHAVKLALKNFKGTSQASGTYPCTDLGPTHLAAIAQGFGLRSKRVHSTEELRHALDELDAQPGPALIEVMVTTDGAGNTPR